MIKRIKINNHYKISYKRLFRTDFKILKAS